MPGGEQRAFGLVSGGQEIERGIAQSPPSGGDRAGRIGAIIGKPVVGGEQRILEVLPNRLAQRLAGEMDRIGIDIFADFPRDIGFARQSERLRGESRIGAFFDDDAQVRG